MVEDALAAADASVNFADFDQDNDGFVDAITIIHSGYGGEAAGASANSIWSHRYALSSRSGGSAWTSADKNANNVNVKVDPYHTEPALWGTAGLAPTRIGVIAHELGHFFGLPDLYDTDVSNGGIGNWCLMANSWGWDQSQRYPPLPSAWCRDQLGWVTLLVPSGPGTVTVPAVAVTPQVWYITRGFPAGEYLLIENRQAVGFDQQIPQGGLAIWHIDENAPGNMNEGFPGQSGWPGNGNHFRVALLQADGNYDLEQYATTNNRGDAGDLYQNVPSIALDETTVPNCDAYQGGAVYPTGIQISNVSPSSASMTFTYRPGVWVDFAWNGTQTGTFAQPFKTVSGGMSAAGPGGAVIFKAGSSPATGTFGTSSTPSYWRPWTGTVTIGQ
jgi:M6 family metalloprotease-like protein